MADEQAPNHPQPPAGFQGPGVPGAGNLLDPAVRGELREQIQPAVHGAAAQVRGEPPATEPPAATVTHRAGPHPHGDVDLSFIKANVPAEPVKPRRDRASRRFYFLPDTAQPHVETPTVTPPTGPKP